MSLRVDRVFWSHCSPRERWESFYALYRMAYKSHYPYGTAYQCFLIMLPDHPDVQKMMHCVRASEMSWLDVSLSNPLRRTLFDRQRSQYQKKLARALLRMIFEDED